MSDDIDRLKAVLSDMRVINDGLLDTREVMGDVVRGVTPIELETDPEGHAALRDMAAEVQGAFNDLLSRTLEVYVVFVALASKARLS